MKQHRFTAKRVDEDEMEAECSCGEWSAGAMGIDDLDEATARMFLREEWQAHLRRVG